MSTLELEVGDLKPRVVELTASELVVTLMDGRKIATPLAWYPRLQRASTAERARFEIMPMGIHWPDIDEDLSIAGMLKGRRAR
jgi:Protein of unknown function (DUF2442)